MLDQWGDEEVGVGWTKCYWGLRCNSCPSFQRALTVTYETIAVSKSKPRNMSSPKKHSQGPGHWGIFGRVRRGMQRTYRHGAEVQKERVRLFTRLQDVGWRHGWRRDLLLFDFFGCSGILNFISLQKYSNLDGRCSLCIQFFLLSRKISFFCFS